jgi:hypothetical protein
LPNDGTIIQNYIDYTLVSQLNATGNVSTSNVVTVDNTWAVRKEPSKKKGDIFNLSMSTISAPVTLFGHFYSGGDEISIYQGNTLIKTATNAAVLTDADKTKLYSNAVPSSWFKGIIFKNFSLSGSEIKNSFKISWTHNPAAGLNYTIKVVNDSSVWRYAIEYPINSTTISTSNNSSTAPVIYNGVMTVSPEALSTRILN